MGVLSSNYVSLIIGVGYAVSIVKRKYVAKHGSASEWRIAPGIRICSRPMGNVATCLRTYGKYPYYSKLHIAII